jgi:predicted ABC-type ATPase
MSLRKKCQSEITVLAGVNGAGKSSIGGVSLRVNGAEYFNADEVARALRADSGLSQKDANGIAWEKGKEMLGKAIRAGRDYNFESTLGGNSITDMLVDAASLGAVLNVWYVGLESVKAATTFPKAISGDVGLAVTQI